MRIFKVIIVSFIIILLFLSCFIIGCSNNGSTDNDDGDGNGTPTVTGELVGVFTYTTSWVTGPTGYPEQRTTLSGYVPLIEDEDGNLYRLAAAGRHSQFIYDGVPMIEVITTIAGYTYTDPLSNYETRDVGGQTRKVYYTGIQVAITGIVDTDTVGSFPGDWIDVEAIEELL